MKKVLALLAALAVSGCFTYTAQGPSGMTCKVRGTPVGATSTCTDGTGQVISSSQGGLSW
jgi:hypothetical protein